MLSQNFKFFLGASRVQRLWGALVKESRRSLERSSLFVLSALVLLLCYSAVLLQDSIISFRSVLLISSISLVGFVTWFRLSDRGTLFGGWGHVHTAFALGVIPALVIVAMFREAFMLSLSGEGGESMSIWQLFGIIVGVSLFAGISEEVVFRGLLLSALRRLWNERYYRDLLSVSVSALMFGAFHAILWGPIVGVALIGVGVGLGVGYLASGERLGTVIVYHAAFDFFSLITAVTLLNL